MVLKPMEPYGLALKDFYEGNKQVKVVFHRDDGIKDDYFVSHCFRAEREFSPIEKKALALCRGKVLDIGAGAGPHSLSLQNRGLKVCAIDVSSHACEIMKEKGVKNVKCLTIYDLKEQNFDTILLMGCAIGLAEDIPGLKSFLERCKVLLNSSGQILLDSLDIRMTEVPEHLAYQERNRRLGRYIGTVGLQMEYKGVFGEEFKLLHVDPDTLRKCTQEIGWSCEILINQEDGDYLAKISN